jgi:hypothetical protein
VGGSSSGGMPSGGSSSGGSSSGGSSAGGSSSGGGGSVTLPPGCVDGLSANCNPVTNEACNTASGEACDFGDKNFECYPAPNDQKLGATCSNANFCEGTLHCDTVGDSGTGTCKKFCCSSSDCSGGTCTAFDAKLGTLGLCN